HVRCFPRPAQRAFFHVQGLEWRCTDAMHPASRPMSPVCMSQVPAPVFRVSSLPASMACALALGLPGPAMAEAAPAADSALTSLRTTPTTWRLTSETWDLPG